jgi:DEAD/DEAH box helicase domain-containing protein
MRTYAPADVASVLAAILDEPSLARGVLHHAVEPARGAQTVPFPAWLDPRIGAALRHGGIDALYTHQGQALDAVHAGRDVCVVTPTASGKSLCYELPVLQALADDPSARALWLFPTKALGQDQVAAFRELARASGLPVSASTYDGDTPAPIRSTIRAAGQVVVTNPDMLHAAILPHHTKWFQLFEQLRVIVIDELHTYRGLFGSHVANVLRRLLRLCAHYGSRPVIVTCSATIANPGELAALLTGRAPLVVDRSGAPAGERHLLFVDPPMVDAASGARGSSLTLAQRWALPFLRAGRQTIVFGRSRTAVELILTGLRETLREHAGPRSRVRGYRGGYLPTERRAIEEACATATSSGSSRRTRSSSASTSGASTPPSSRATPAPSPPPASRSGGPGGAWARASRSSWPPRRPSTSTSSTTRSSSSTSRPRRPGSIRTTSTSSWLT